MEQTTTYNTYTNGENYEQKIKTKSYEIGEAFINKSGEKILIISTDAYLEDGCPAYTYINLVQELEAKNFNEYLIKKEDLHNSSFKKYKPTDIEHSYIILIFKKYMERFNHMYYKLKTYCEHVVVRNTSFMSSATCQYCQKYCGWYCELSPDHVCHYESRDNFITLVDGTTIPIPPSHIVELESDICIFCSKSRDR